MLTRGFRPCRTSVVQRKANPIGRLCTHFRCSATAAPPSEWQDFAKNVSGEWEGTTCTFSPDGKPQPLPERYVPGAFREWGVELYDWQAQCSTLALVEEGTLTHRVRRMMPTVGCEADAVAYTEDAQTLWLPASSSSKGLQARTVLADGSYFAGPATLLEDRDAEKIEFCFALPGSSPTTRLRLIIHMNKSPPTGHWQPSQYEVHSEKFEAPYQGGIDQLLGCGGGSEGFAQGAQTSEQDAAALGWQTVSGWVYNKETASEHPIAWAPDRSVPKLEGDVSTVLLPLGLFSNISTLPGATAGATNLAVEVGVVHSKDTRTVGRAVYVDSQLSAFSLVGEKR